MGIDASGEAWRQTAADQLRRGLGEDVMVAFPVQGVTATNLHSLGPHPKTVEGERGEL